MCADICTDMRTAMYIDMRTEMCTDTCAQSFAQRCIQPCIPRRIQTLRHEYGSFKALDGVYSPGCLKTGICTIVLGAMF